MCIREAFDPVSRGRDAIASNERETNSERRVCRRRPELAYLTVCKNDKKEEENIDFVRIYLFPKAPTLTVHVANDVRRLPVLDGDLDHALLLLERVVRAQHDLPHVPARQGLAAGVPLEESGEEVLRDRVALFRGAFLVGGGRLPGFGGEYGTRVVLFHRTSVCTFVR